MWGLAERKTSRFGRDIDIDDLYDQLDTLRGYVGELSHGASKSAGEGLGRAREFASQTAHDAEETMKDNLTASLLLALGIGLVAGYFIRSGTK